ncbi:MAG: hypothetical protein ACRC53_12770 [Plesiomonas sp.]|uniref:hypothetical protein n=1 Tax=Plesiomonas sp. TaxID=2486279 RepID=UPI003F34C945
MRIIFQTVMAAAIVMSAGSYAEERIFPIWGDKAKERGYTLPEPFGLNISYMNVRQGIQVDSIAFTGIQTHLPIQPNFLNIHGNLDIGINPTVKQTSQHSDTKTLRADMWVFPFLNLYGVLGKTQGRTDSLLDIDISVSGHAQIGSLFPIKIPLPTFSIPLKDIRFPLEFNGDTYGMGVVLAGGYEQWFALADVNYTQTKMDILDGHIAALVASPRVGYIFSVADRPLRVWVGGMYQSIDQQFRGNIADLALPANLKQLLLLVDPNKQGKFEVNQHLKSPWNTLLGAQYQVNPNLSFLTEWGLGERKSAFFSLDIRF